MGGLRGGSARGLGLVGSPRAKLATAGEEMAPTPRSDRGRCRRGGSGGAGRRGWAAQRWRERHARGHGPAVLRGRVGGAADRARGGPRAVQRRVGRPGPGSLGRCCRAGGRRVPTRLRPQPGPASHRAHRLPHPRRSRGPHRRDLREHRRRHGTPPRLPRQLLDLLRRGRGRRRQLRPARAGRRAARHARRARRRSARCAPRARPART